MKLTAIFIFCAFVINAQTKIDFRDGKSMALKGKVIGTFAKPDFSDPTIIAKNIQTYFGMDGDTLEISVYSEYANKSFDDLQIFRIHKNQITIDLDYYTVDNETNENEEVTHYSFTLSANDEQKFQYRKYTIYSSIGKAQSFNTFTLYSNQKEGLEELFKIINN